MCASTLCPLLSSTRNIAFGSASITLPSISMTPSFFAMSSANSSLLRVAAAACGDGAHRGTRPFPGSRQGDGQARSSSAPSYGIGPGDACMTSLTGAGRSYPPGRGTRAEPSGGERLRPPDAPADGRSRCRSLHRDRPGGPATTSISTPQVRAKDSGAHLGSGLRPGVVGGASPPGEEGETGTGTEGGNRGEHEQPGLDTGPLQLSARGGRDGGGDVRRPPRGGVRRRGRGVRWVGGQLSPD